MKTRREAILMGSAVAGGIGSLSCLCHAREPIFGCVLPPSRTEEFLNKSSTPRLYITGDEPIALKSGNKDFDYALAQTLAKISSVFNVLPGFAYYDDTESKNAYATEKMKLKLTNADGTVLFGQILLDETLAGKDNPDVAVAAICAHEFGHILQFKHGLDKVVLKDQTTVKRAELQADYFAGYFAGIRKREKPSFPAAVFAMTQFMLGDDNVNSKSHHGKPDERGKAVSEGFNASYKLNMTIAECIAASTKFVMTM